MRLLLASENERRFSNNIHIRICPERRSVSMSAKLESARAFKTLQKSAKSQEKEAEPDETRGAANYQSLKAKSARSTQYYLLEQMPKRVKRHEKTKDFVVIFYENFAIKITFRFIAFTTLFQLH